MPAFVFSLAKVQKMTFLLHRHLKTPLSPPCSQLCNPSLLHSWEFHDAGKDRARILWTGRKSTDRVLPFRHYPDESVEGSVNWFLDVYTSCSGFTSEVLQTNRVDRPKVQAFGFVTSDKK